MQNSGQEIINQLIKELDEMFDGKASKAYINEYLFVDWGQHEYTQDAWLQAFEEKNSNQNSEYPFS